MGSASDFGGKPDLVTAGRSSSQGCREGANGHRILLTPLARLSGMSESIRHYHLILTVDPQNSQPLHHPRCSNPEKIPRVPSSWKPESKITNVSRGQHVPCEEHVVCRRYSEAGVFLPVSANETLAWEPEVVLRDAWHVSPHPAGLWRGFAPLCKTQNALPAMNESNPKSVVRSLPKSD